MVHGVLRQLRSANTIFEHRYQHRHRPERVYGRQFSRSKAKRVVILPVEMLARGVDHIDRIDRFFFRIAPDPADRRPHAIEIVVLQMFA